MLKWYIIDSSKIKTQFRFQRGFRRSSKKTKRVTILKKTTKKRIINKQLFKGWREQGQFCFCFLNKLPLPQDRKKCPIRRQHLQVQQEQVLSAKKIFLKFTLERGNCLADTLRFYAWCSLIMPPAKMDRLISICVHRIKRSCKDFFVEEVGAEADAKVQSSQRHVEIHQTAVRISNLNYLFELHIVSVWI